MQKLKMNPNYVKTAAFLLISGLLFLVTASDLDNEILESEKKPVKIAIIGGGIGGTSAAYFLKERLEKHADVNIHLFEKSSRLGGRTKIVNVFGNDYETGGSVLHPRNRYATELVQHLGLSQKTDLDGWGFSVLNGKNEVVFNGSRWTLINIFRMLWRYGLQFKSVESLVSSFIDKFSTVYQKQRSCVAYETPLDMMEALNPLLKNLTELSLREYLLGKDYSPLVIDEMVQAITYVNYGQSAEIPAFVGSVAIAGAGSSLWSVKGGNNNLAIALANHTDDLKIHFDTEISKISKTSDGKFVLESRSTNYLKDVTFDYVVISTPLEVSKIDIPFVGPVTKGSFHRTISTVVGGHMKPKYHKLGDIFTTQSSNFFTTVSRIFPTGLFVAEHVPVYKIFSPKKLTQEQLEEIFEKVEFIHVDDWFAYPHYTSADHIPPFKLFPGLFYTNAIEWTASAMEMSLISAKNIAITIAKDLDFPCLKVGDGFDSREEL